MPYRQPFTALCQATARDNRVGRADLHIHTTASDGAYTPAEAVELAIRTRLAAVAITDHDTVNAVPAARVAAADRVEIISGVELVALQDNFVIHLLGYFIDIEDDRLLLELSRLRRLRIERFREMLARLASRGIQLELPDVEEATVLGRMHLAKLLVKAGRAASPREAFARYLHDRAPAVVPHQAMDLRAAITMIHNAGGIAAWAHPSDEVTRERLKTLRKSGLDALEVDFPGCRVGRSRQLRNWAADFGLATTGGSDCHGPDAPRRAIGTHGIDAGDLERLRMTGCKLT